MAAFHVMRWVPDPRLHILRGYDEVIETLAWGLRALGHEVTEDTNVLRPGAIPIVLGAQLMPPAMIERLPPDTILYNLEQLHGLQASGREIASFAHACRRLEVWDYSTANIEIWRRLGVTRALHMPVAFAPVLARIAPAEVQDIDALLYGGVGERRMAVVSELCRRGRSVMFVCGLYGAARDALIGRSKLVLSVSSDTPEPIFSVVRASYLLANGKAVVADHAAVERDIAPAIAFAPLAGVADLACHHLDHPEERRKLEQAGTAAMARRDVRGFLLTALKRPEHAAA